MSHFISLALKTLNKVDVLLVNSDYMPSFRYSPEWCSRLTECSGIRRFRFLVAYQNLSLQDKIQFSLSMDPRRHTQTA